MSNIAQKTRAPPQHTYSFRDDDDILEPGALVVVVVVVTYRIYKSLMRWTVKGLRHPPCCSNDENDNKK